MSPQPSPRRLLTISGLLLLLLVLFLAGELWFLKSRKSLSANGTHFSEKSSQQFGESLQRAGIETQPEASH